MFKSLIKNAHGDLENNLLLLHVSIMLADFEKDVLHDECVFESP